MSAFSVLQFPGGSNSPSPLLSYYAASQLYYNRTSIPVFNIYLSIPVGVRLQIHIIPKRPNSHVAAVHDYTSSVCPVRMLCYIIHHCPSKCNQIAQPYIMVKPLLNESLLSAILFMLCAFSIQIRVVGIVIYLRLTRLILYL